MYLLPAVLRLDTVNLPTAIIIMFTSITIMLCVIDEIKINYNNFRQLAAKFANKINSMNTVHVATLSPTYSIKSGVWNQWASTQGHQEAPGIYEGRNIILLIPINWLWSGLLHRWIHVWALPIPSKVHVIYSSGRVWPTGKNLFLEQNCSAYMQNHTMAFVLAHCTHTQYVHIWGGLIQFT